MRALRLSLAGTITLALLGGLSGTISAQDTDEPDASEPGALTEAFGDPADSGARIVEIEQRDERMLDLTIDSPAVGLQKARLLLPADFDPDGDDAWPVLYLLQGCCGDYTAWTRNTDVSELTAELDLLVVMPEAGEWGWYSDWHNRGRGGPPMWETFHLTEVRQLLERNWQAGEDRVVAGLSMGGFGAMSYAARHPEMFKAAASFSGVLHSLAKDMEVDRAVWGAKKRNADIWAAHDPVSLAADLEGISLYVSYGNGKHGKLDEVRNKQMAQLERDIARHNTRFVKRLDALGIPVTVDASRGTHTWPYWERGLHRAMPMLLEALGIATVEAVADE